MLKSIGLLAVLGAGAVYMTGGLGGGYSRVVDRPPAEVLAALRDLDIREQPGEPGTDAAASGGVLPLFRMAESADAISWQVMSGQRIAVTMRAELVPLDGGKRTRVIARVERGDAPDDVTSPAFRSHGITMGLFGMALEDELNELTAIAAADPEACRELAERFLQDNIGSAEDLQSTDGVADAAGDRAKLVLLLQAGEMELRQRGCDPAQGTRANRFAVSERMRAAPAPHQTEPGGDAPRFVPGQPMHDARPADARP